MTPNEMTILKSLVAVAWADGEIQAPEAGLIDGLVWAFDASEQEEAEVREYAKKRRTLKDGIPVGSLSASDKEILLAHAALLTHADGEQTAQEKRILADLIKMLGFSLDQAKPIVASAPQRAKKLAGKV